jgi:NADH-quinone oxidoreductase subunit J
MVLFLFVIMLLGVDRLPAGDSLRLQPYLAIPLALILALLFALPLFQWAGQVGEAAAVPDSYGAPGAVGELLFTQFILPFEVTGVILLVATVGAIILAKPDRPSIGQAVRRTEAAAQEKVLKEKAAPREREVV